LNSIRSIVNNRRQLEVFCAVAASRTFTGASHSLFISQSTVSQHVQELESDLGLKLFHRTRRTVTPTPAADVLLEHAHDIFRRLEEAETAAKTIRQPYCCKLSFGCASTTPFTIFLHPFRLHAQVSQRGAAHQQRIGSGSGGTDVVRRPGSGAGRAAYQLSGARKIRARR
jgi:DNA-binding transcriptional LysR family regulator